MPRHLLHVWDGLQIMRLIVHAASFREVFIMEPATLNPIKAATVRFGPEATELAEPDAPGSPAP
jgi:hypothetical protein